MSDDDVKSTRRNVLKLAGSTAIAAGGFSTAATAAAVEWDENDVVTDDNGNSEWVLRVNRETRESEVTVETAKETAEASQEAVVRALANRQEYSVKGQFWLANALLVTAAKESDAAAQELSSLSGVRTVHPNFEFEGPEPVEKQELVPKQKDAEYTYGLEQINAPDLWEHFDTKGGGTSVAVLDTGVDATHPDIDLPEENWAFFDEDGNLVDESEPFDPNGHGTHTSGTVSGGSASGYQIGVAPETELYHAKVLNNGGTWAQIVAGMQWAVVQGVDAINMSLGGGGYSDAYIEPVQNVVNQGTILVSSSGNSGPETTGSPADVYESFAIGASNSAREIASFSSGDLVETQQWDSWWLTEDWPLNYYVPDVAAPGVSVVSSVPGGWARYDGTSMAAPHVAGAVALLLSENPDLTVEEIKEYFETTAIHGDGADALVGPRYGEGIIDVLSATTAATDANVVEGTVTYGGQPVPGVVVETDYGTRAHTDENGEFSLYLGDGEWTLSVDEFGFVSEGVTVNVSGGDTVTQEVELVDELDVQPAAYQPDIVGRGEAFDLPLTVANLETVTVCLADGSDLEADDLTLRLAGEELELCEPLDLQTQFDGKTALTVEVDAEAPLGTFSLEHEFAGVGESVTLTTGPTEVMDDPEPAALEIVDWDQTQEIVMGGTFPAWATVENTGDHTARQMVYWWLEDPNGINVFPVAFLELQGGEQRTLEFPIGIPAAFKEPGTDVDHGWRTQTAILAQGTATFNGPEFEFVNVDADDQVDYGDTMEVIATLQNVGPASGGDTVEFYFDGIWLDAVDVEGDVGDLASVTFEFDSTRVVRDEYDYSLVTNWTERTDDVWIGPVQVPEIDVNGNGKPATDTTGDGLFNDVDGDGEFLGADVFAFYQHYDDPEVQNNADYFDFNGDGVVDEADIDALIRLYLQET